MYPKDETRGETLIKFADQALYSAKETRNQLKYFNLNLKVSIFKFNEFISSEKLFFDN
ncbi:GGDEF domain-containing protein [Neobacillus drentensis]|uniref:GGDEF domain-containing protein n=1 Tax=Neobacillus drentensis TaxID=220684 RepID=UPI001F2F2FC2|nr:GGDEF domain-containing protein [Neobacillus drentensis]